MQIISLKKLVEDNDINVVAEFQGEGVSPFLFEVGTVEYTEKENYLVKGEYRIEEDAVYGIKTLHVPLLQKDLDISINKPTIIAGEATPEDEARLEEFINTPITAIVFHRGTLDSAGRDIKRQHTKAFAQSVIESYNKTRGEARDEDFALIEIDFVNKSVSIKKLEL